MLDGGAHRLAPGRLLVGTDGRLGFVEAGLPSVPSVAGAEEDGNEAVCTWLECERCKKWRIVPEAYAAGVWQMDEAELQMVFHSHFSDESRQDAATTHAHQTELFTHLREMGELMAGMTIWEDTDGCGKQYRCGTALYLLSMLACTFDVTIDRAIGAPGHGKDVVDGLNATDKCYLRKMMCMIGTPEANDSQARMAAHSMIDGAAMSLVLQALASTAATKEELAEVRRVLDQMEGENA